MPASPRSPRSKLPESRSFLPFVRWKLPKWNPVLEDGLLSSYRAFMKKNTPWHSALCLAASFLALPAAFAGVVYELETREGEDAPQQVEIRAQGKQLKMIGGSESQNDFVIYDGSDKSLTIANAEERSYFVLEQAQIAQLKESMAAARRQMEQALAQVPESQRARMRQMMENSMPGMTGMTAEPPEVTIEQTGKKRTISGYPTTQYVVKVNGKRSSELWVTPWDKLEGSRELRESFNDMIGFFTSFFDALPQMGANLDDGRSNWMRALQKIDGFPVESRYYEAGAEDPSETTTLKSIRTKELSGSDFSPPEGYTRRSMEIPG